MDEDDKSPATVLAILVVCGLLVLAICWLTYSEPEDIETVQATTLAPTEEAHTSEDVPATANEAEAVVLQQGATYEQARAWLAIGLVCMSVALTLWGYIDRNQTEAWDYLDNAIKVKLIVAWTLFIIAAVTAIPLVIGYGYKVLSYIK